MSVSSSASEPNHCTLTTVTRPSGCTPRTAQRGCRSSTSWLGALNRGLCGRKVAGPFVNGRGKARQGRAMLAWGRGAPSRCLFPCTAAPGGDPHARRLARRQPGAAGEPRPRPCGGRSTSSPRGRRRCSRRPRPAGCSRRSTLARSRACATGRSSRWGRCRSAGGRLTVPVAIGSISRDGWSRNSSLSRRHSHVATIACTRPLQSRSIPPRGDRRMAGG